MTINQLWMTLTFVTLSLLETLSVYFTFSVEQKYVFFLPPVYTHTQIRWNAACQSERESERPLRRRRYHRNAVTVGRDVATSPARIFHIFYGVVDDKQSSSWILVLVLWVIDANAPTFTNYLLVVAVNIVCPDVVVYYSNGLNIETDPLVISRWNVNYLPK